MIWYKKNVYILTQIPYLTVVYCTTFEKASVYVWEKSTEHSYFDTQCKNISVFLSCKCLKRFCTDVENFKNYTMLNVLS